MDNMSMGGMAMQFFFGYQCSFIFPNVKLDTPGGKKGTVLGWRLGVSAL